MMSWAGKHAIIGVIYGGVEKSGRELCIPFDTLMQWVGHAQQIELRNKQLNEVSVKVRELFNKAGFRSCILKGQGVALYYPNPLLRTPGDIDIWLEGGYKKIIRFIMSWWPGQKQHYHHVEIPQIDDVEVEVHYRPSYMRTPWYNHRFQRWCMIKGEEQFSHLINIEEGCKIYAPTMDFNAIFLLQHMFNHLFTEGIGLRQIIDYYYLLRSDVRGQMC